MSAHSKFKCQHLPDVLPESCVEMSKFCDNENPLWAKLGLTNIPGLAETSRKKGGAKGIAVLPLFPIFRQFFHFHENP